VLHNGTVVQQQALSTQHSTSLICRGWQAQLIEVELRLLLGQPKLQIIGLASQVVNEAKQRITAALQACAVRPRARKTVINLAPAELKKTASHLDLAMAVALLQSYGLVPDVYRDSLFIGELALDGRLKPCRQLWALLLAAKDLPYKRVFFPAAAAENLPIMDGLELLPLSSLQEFIAFARGQCKLQAWSGQKFRPATVPVIKDGLELTTILGQTHVKRALQLSAAGTHHLLLIGPPGLGKTLLARSLAQLLPPLTEAEFLEVNRLYSLAGLQEGNLIQERPFRAPAGQISLTALLGDARRLLPGELSLAHHGVLFLDELANQSQQKLLALRQPLDQRQVALQQAGQLFLFPAAFTLLAASNPCPCGYVASARPCRCSLGQLRAYRQRLAGPLLDRFDLLLRVNWEKELTKNKKVTMPSLAELRQQVTQAKERQRRRLQQAGLALDTNLEQRPDLVKQLCPLTPAAQQALEKAAIALSLSLRAYFKIIRLAQSIADLDQLKIIDQAQVIEALSFRQSW